ncbi:MAG TPA: hypothetical protein VG712_04105 [Gemmatimonadales bacterium]|nr:hypothetical protein [Gemmatimonadales bacterium]
MRSLLVLAASLAASPVAAQTVTEQPLLGPVEFRGLHALSKDVVWASGSNGWVYHTTTGGTHWTIDTIPGVSSLFLVDIFATDDRHATVVGTDFRGGYAAIYATEDGGRRWRKEWELRDPRAFLDAVTILGDGTGLALGDPMDGHYLILVRRRGDSTWAAPGAPQIPCGPSGPVLPAADSGRGAYAASGTALTRLGDRGAAFGTGGSPFARVYTTTDRGSEWQRSDTPLPAGTSAGIFGIAFENDTLGLAVGGDYQLPNDTAANVLRTTDGGRTWTLAGRTTPIGVRWGLTSGGRGRYLATAPTGTGITEDGGATWRVLDAKPANTASCAGGVCWLAGRNRLAKVTF